MRQARKLSSLEKDIEANLKRVYDDVANEDVPDRFTDLLNQLRATQAASRLSSDE